jgi:hypothetical protein
MTFGISATTALLVGGAATVGGALISANAAGKASRAQSDAAGEAADLQYRISQEQIAAQKEASIRQLEAQKEALDKQLAAQGGYLDKQLAASYKTLEEQLAFQKQIYEQQRTDLAPYRAAGEAGQNKLLEYLGIGGDRAAANYGKFATAEFTPEAFAANQDPGYGFRVKEGLKAIEANAAARGGLISGAALKAAGRYGQDMASQEYTNAFNRFQTMRGNTLSPYDRLQGVGLNAVNMTGNAGATYGGAGNQAYGALGSGLYNAYGSASQGATGAYGAAGAGASNAYGALGTGTYNALGGYGAGASEAMLGGANARASGYVGGANAISGGISNLSNMYYQNQLLNMLRTPEQRAIAQYGSGNVFTPSGGGFVPSGVKDYAF